MEFSGLGKHCKICNQKDFLPFTCDYCKYPHCLEHQTVKSHDCQPYQKEQERKQKKIDKRTKDKIKIKYPFKCK